jgi:serine/threonine protein kinase
MTPIGLGDHTLAPQQRIGNYLLLEKLGSGGLGEVWKARDQVLNRVVAMKFVTAASETGGSRELLKEARAASALNHPNIVTVFEVGESPHGAYMTMEVVEGETLRAKMTRGRLALSDIHDIALQVCKGLAVAHAHGIVHRDLKPENIMIRADGYVKILDFGLAKRLPWAQSDAAGSMTASQGTATGHLAGTFAYMSPEQARGLEVGPASDVFSFGVILHEMLTGTHPFRGQTVMDTLHNIVSADLPDVSMASPLASVVRRCLAKDAAQRYSDARILAEVLQASGSVGFSAPAVALPIPSALPGHDTPLQPGNVIWTPRWARALGALLCAAILAVAYVPSLTLGSSESSLLPKVSSVAVLNFRAPAGDDALSSIGQDLAEELSNQLARSGMRVAPQGAVAALGPATLPQDAAKRLLVDAVFVGTIRLSNDQVKIRVELVDGRSGLLTWGDTLTSPRTEVATRGPAMAEETLNRLRIALAARQ